MLQSQYTSTRITILRTRKKKLFSSFEFQRKGSISSNSFSYARSPSKSVRHQTIVEDDYEDGARQINYKCPVKSELTVNPSDDNNVVTLTHTVSFYRRQQSQVWFYDTYYQLKTTR